MGQKIEKVKTHFRENKKTYLACGGTAVVAVVGTLLFVNRQSKLTVGDRDNSENNQDIKQLSGLLTWKPVATQTIFDTNVSYHIEPLGHPGNVVVDELTGNVYPSQGATARSLEVSPRLVSDHLNGKTDDVLGHKLKVVGRAGDVDLVGTSR